MRRKLTANWAWCLVILYCLGVIVFYAIAGEENAHIAIADNLDLFQAQYQMLRNTGTFFAHGVEAPFLHGVTRNDLPSELSLATLLYVVLPPFAAYIANYLVKILLAAAGFQLLADELNRRALLTRFSPVLSGHFSENQAERTTRLIRNLSVLGGFAYGLLNLFPAFGISFSSIPLLLWLLLRLARAENRRSAARLYLAIFCYPFVSYFSYFGLFILGYLCLAWLWTSIARRRLNHRLFLAIVVLALGSMVFEYRLFASMLFSSETTIRESMKIAPFTGSQILQAMGSVLRDGGTMHTQDVHPYLVLPVCLAYWLLLNIGYLRRREGRRIFHDIYNLAVLILLFNTAVYGLYYWEPFRSLVEGLIPPLKGWQFNRTVFFNPFLWYGMFCLALLRLAAWAAGHTAASSAETSGHDTQTGTSNIASALASCLAIVLSLSACLVILAIPTQDNDVYHTLHAMAYERIKGQKEDALSYGEFYSTELFAEAEKAIGYDGEWSAAYGFHPAVLEYNGICTIDGYLGFYSQAYKEQFREVIAPALERQGATRQYYDDWGARCYLYSGTEGTNVEAVRHYTHEQEELYVNPEALRALDCRYLFSRPEITNAEELGLTLAGVFTDPSSPYVLHVYAVN